MVTAKFVYFPIVFFDGHRETSIGGVDFYPSLELKSFRSLMSCMVGIPPRLLSVYLIVKHRSKTLKRIPINEGSVFAVISRLLIEDVEGFESIMCSMVGIPPRLLSVYFAVKHRSKTLMKIPITGRYVQQARELQNGSVDEDHEYGGNGVVECEECTRAKELGSEVEFHCCVYDAKVVEFRSKAGPISRSVKSSE